MIAYFADRKFNIIGQASTQLPAGILIKDDLKSEDVETGIAIFDGYVTGVIGDIINWAIVLLLAVFVFYLIRYFFKRK